MNNKEANSKLLFWFDSLEHNHRDRAVLRRTQTPNDVLVTHAFYNFLNHMPEDWKIKENLYKSAFIAVVCSNIKQNTNNESFAEQLSHSDEKHKVISPLRFLQLQKSTTPDEFFRRLIRIIKILKGKVNIISITNDIIQWLTEYNEGPSLDFMNSLAFTWASAYYN